MILSSLVFSAAVVALHPPRPKAVSKGEED